MIYFIFFWFSSKERSLPKRSDCVSHTMILILPSFEASLPMLETALMGILEGQNKLRLHYEYMNMNRRLYKPEKVVFDT